MNTYICKYKNQEVKIFAETTYQAQEDAKRAFRVKNGWEIIVMLAKIGEVVVVHTAGELP